MTIAYTESCFPFIACLDSQAIIGILEVDFAEVLGPCDSVYDLSDQGQRVSIFDCNSIQASVVYAKT